MVFSISLLFGIYAAYEPGLSGSFYYDDYFSFQGLLSVQDLRSALYYITSGETGPLGRPVSLVSFLLHTTDWPSQSENIFQVNIFIHLINGFLLIWLLSIILDVLSTHHHIRNLWTAIGTTALWLSLPILVSTTLIAVQRMTSLSAMFTLSGLLLYLIGIQRQNNHHRNGLILQLLGIGGGTLFAALSKENGLLLPVYALVLELTLLRGRQKHPDHAKRLVLLSIPFFIIIGYLISKTINSQESFGFRDFSLYERVITQPSILLDYLRLAFFPRFFSFSPFHDNYPISTGLFSPISTVIALVIWSGLIITATVFRIRWPMLAFAVYWFLAGHLLESTVLPLEPYFEHRNYLPLIGPCLGLSWLTRYLSERGYRIAPVIFIAYIALMMALLYQTTLLWGDQHLAAEIWYQKNPTSPRTAQNLAIVYSRTGDVRSAIRILDETVKACPSCLSLVFEALKLACTQEPSEKIKQRLDFIWDKIGLVRSDLTPVASLTKIYSLQREGNCPFISSTTLVALNRALLENPYFSAQSGGGPNLGLHYNLYELYHDQGRLQAALNELYAAWKADQGIEIAFLIIDQLIESASFDEAFEFTKMAREVAPLHPARRWWWIDNINALEEKIAAVKIKHQVTTIKNNAN